MRKLISLLLLISGAALLVTSGVLYIVPTGRIAYWADYHLLWLTKAQWTALHTNFGFLVIVCSVFHLCFNFRALLSYLRNRARRISLLNSNFITALIICIYVGVGTVFGLQPMAFIEDMSKAFEKQAEVTYGKPPYGHAESSTLAKFCKKTGLDLDTALEALQDAGLVGVSSEQSLKDIARNNKMTPQGVYHLIQQEVAREDAHASSDEDRQPIETEAMREGLGQKTLGQFCEEQGISLENALIILHQVGIDAEAEQQLKDIAWGADTTPRAIVEMIQ